MPHWLTQILYLVSAVLFIIGLKRLGSARPRRGRGTSSRWSGMFLAILVTLVDPAICRTG